MVLGSALAREVGSSAGAAALSAHLQRAEDAGRRPLLRGKCDPAGDATLGYVVAHVLPQAEGVTVVDVTSTARVHFWRARASAVALRSTLGVMHHAERCVHMHCMHMMHMHALHRAACSCTHCTALHSHARIALHCMHMHACACSCMQQWREQRKK